MAIPGPRPRPCGVRCRWPQEVEGGARFFRNFVAFHAPLATVGRMSDVVLSYRGRPIGGADVDFLRELITRHPELSRRQISVKVCQAWNWVQPNGQPRDMVCRGLMLALHRAGRIELPAKRYSPPNNAIAHRRVGQVPP